jgi:hypothetical protein
MTSDQLLKMIGEWELKTNEEFAEEFGLSVRTIQRYARMAREVDPRFCQRRNMRYHERAAKVFRLIQRLIPGDSAPVSNHF